MHLLIDSGNTALKWAFAQDGQLLPMSKFIVSPENLSEQLQAIANSQEINKVRAVYISNVAGATRQKQLTDWCKEAYQIAPTYAFVAKEFNGLVNAYNPFEKLGVDRWLALIAATDCFKRPICVVDIGTAVTIDAIDDENHYIGGVILPGLGLMRQSLQQNTDAIGFTQDQDLENIFATNTEHGVISGTSLAIAATVENMTENLHHKTNEPITCVLTGGDALHVKSYISQSVEYVPDLVLKGLYLWEKENDLDR